MLPFSGQNVGACLRDGTGQFKKVFSTWCSFFMAAGEGEAWGLLQTLKWFMSMDLDCVIIEMDCKRVVDDLHNSKLDRSEYGLTISQCRTLLSLKKQLQSCVTRQQANGSAHALAQSSINYAIHKTFTSIPYCIWNIIMNEMC